IRGHLKAMCGKNHLNANKGKQGNGPNSKTHQVGTDDRSDSDTDLSEPNYASVHAAKTLHRLIKISKCIREKAWRINVKLCNTVFNLELDSGAEMTVLPFRWYCKYFSHLTLRKTKTSLSTWTLQ